jgi:hypothetical protein
MTLCGRRSRVALLMTAYDSDSKAVGHDRTGGFASLPQTMCLPGRRSSSGCRTGVENHEKALVRPERSIRPRAVALVRIMG